jgi:glyoxalase family protein
LQLGGIHHLTAITADIRDNYRFFTRVLGLRLVKRSVNQDDVSAYHLFYADGAGSPGTDVTFFDWSMPRERRGTHSLARTHLRVNGERTLEWWAKRLADENVTTGGIIERDGRATIDFEDAEGQRLALVDDGGDGDDPVPWDRSTEPEEHQIRGLGPIVMSVPEIGQTAAVLTDVLGMTLAREYSHPASALDQVHVYEMGPGGPAAELHVAVQPDLPVARQGAGGVHHVAFRTPTFADYDGWVATLRSMGVPNSGPIDRFYFRSLYFREPNGVLFEIATDGPGFAVDEDPATLGDDIALPPFLEPHRDKIVAGLKPIE